MLCVCVLTAAEHMFACAHTVFYTHARIQKHTETEFNLSTNRTRERSKHARVIIESERVALQTKGKNRALHRIFIN